MNRNYFELTRDEVIFLILLQCAEVLEIIKEEMKSWDSGKLEECKNTLERKKYLVLDDEGKMKINSRLDSWMYVITHPQTFLEGTSGDDKRIWFFFYEDSIVSLYMNKERIELIWIPYIHLAIGRLLDVVKRDEYQSWSFKTINLIDEINMEYQPSSEEDYMTAINVVSGNMVSLHGIAMKEKDNNE